GRNDVAARALNGLDVEGGELALARLRVPERVVFGVEVALELPQTIQLAVLDLLVVRTTEAVRKRHEMGAVGEVAEPPAVAVTRRDRARRERAAVVAAHEGEHERLAGRVPHDLERVLDRLRP